MQKETGMKIKKILECPLNKKTKLQGRKCKKCEHYCKRKWFSSGGEVEIFCLHGWSETEKRYLK